MNVRHAMREDGLQYAVWWHKCIAAGIMGEPKEDIHKPVIDRSWDRKTKKQDTIHNHLSKLEQQEKRKNNLFSKIRREKDVKVREQQRMMK